jgi:phosphomannomutase
MPAVPRDLTSIFKAYDIRGVYPDELDEDAVARVGYGFAEWIEAGRIVIGRDMRTSSPKLAKAFARGASAGGAEVIDVGEVSTDALYFASGRLDLPGAMFTASHNPPRYNGIKLCRERAAPVGEASGLQEILELSSRADDIPDGGSVAVERMEILADYGAHCRALIDERLLKPLRVAIDAGNGMAGLTVPIVFEPLPIEVVPLFFELDGTFPNHPANPIEPANIADLQNIVRERGCDVGIAFDGDADRMFLVDENAAPVSGSVTTALVTERLLKRSPGEVVIYNLICSRTVPEVIEENGGRPVKSRVGHSFIKQMMAETGAIFGGEHSGHYYFRDNFRADSGMIAALLVLEALSEAGVPLSQLLKPFDRYSASGEINSEVRDQQAVIEKVARTYQDAKQDRMDGLSVEYDDWWFNCRPSNTEPLLRLNLEARTEDLMVAKRDEVLALIRED